MKILCTFGKYQYGDKNRGINTEYFSFLPAFEKLGYEIVFFDTWDKTLYKGFKELNKALVKVVQKEDPDIIFNVQFLYEIWIETWDHIRANFKCKTINWCTDDSWKYKEHSKFFANHFDLMVTTYSEFIDRYNEQGANGFLSAWGAPMQWIKEPKSAEQCKYEVTFIGAAHGDRKQKVEQLKGLGIDVQCFGFGWDNGPVDADDIVSIFNDSIISLNFANSMGENQIKARTFEVPGSGGFLLTEGAKNLDKVFALDEIIIFEGIENCADKIQYYLKNFKERDAIAIKGFQKTSQNYTYSNRLDEIIQAVQQLKKDRIVEVDFEKVLASHKQNLFLSSIRAILIFFGQLIYGKEKGKRFARRIAYEFSWRFCKENTYRSKSIVGRMFYSE